MTEEFFLFVAAGRVAMVVGIVVGSCVCGCCCVACISTSANVKHQDG